MKDLGKPEAARLLADQLKEISSRYVAGHAGKSYSVAK
jgi:hypothetical protein